ncbi:MAG: isocitrate/isopropylmalate dehydrogenase family protein [Acidobacteriota bacterium]
MYSAGVIRGDGIGPEICEAALKVVEATEVKIQWEEVLIGREAQRLMGVELPFGSLEKIRQLGVVLKGPLLAERQSGGVVVEENGLVRRHPSVNNGLRKELGTFVNVRPIRGHASVSGQYKDLDVIIVREVSEDLYSGLERRVNGNCAEAVKRISRQASQRVARFACEYAQSHRRKKITAVHKANVLHETDGLFLESVRSVMAEFPDLAFDDQMVDAAAYLLVRRPQLFDVLVMPNQYGDILSGLTAGLIGSVGLAPGANYGPKVALFEAAHGAAPDIAGQGLANPAGLVLSAAMLLDHLGETEKAERIRGSIAEVLSEERLRTPDLGGRASTTEFCEALCEHLRCPSK